MKDENKISENIKFSAEQLKGWRIIDHQSTINKQKVMNHLKKL